MVELNEAGVHQWGAPIGALSHPDDPRRGLPSASPMDRLSHCSGSHRLIAELRARGLAYERPDPARASGLRIHAYLSGGARKAELTEAEADVAGAAARLADEIYNSWIIYAEGQEDRAIGEIEVWKEERLWVRDGIFPVFSAQPDVCYIAGRCGLIINYKTGRKEQEAAADNLQLRTEAVALKANVPALESIDGAIVEPWVSWHPARVHYDAKALETAAAEIRAIVARAEEAEAKRVAGAWCFYCPARPYCQEARAYVSAIYNFGKEIGLAELPIGDKGSKVIEDIATVREILDSMEACYKQILEANPDALAKHFLQPGRRIRSVNVNQARDRLGRVLTDAEFSACLDASVAKLEKAFAKKSGMKLGQLDGGAERAFADFMGSLIQEKRAAPSIARLTTAEKKRRQLKDSMQTQNEESKA